MKNTAKNESAFAQRQQLFTLCRFLAVQISYRFLLLLLSVTGLLLTVLGRSQFAPYGIALFCLVLPSFLNNTENKNKEKENSDTLMSALYKRYHYSPVMFTAYRITITLCALLLFVWHTVQSSPFTLFGISGPLLYLVLGLALSPILCRILFFVFHRRLMSGII